MQHIRMISKFRTVTVMSASALLMTGLAISAELDTKTFAAGKKGQIHGVIVSRHGDTLKLLANDDSIGTVDLMDDTKIHLKRVPFPFHHSHIDGGSLVPGLYIEAKGKGNEKGELVASKVVFNSNSMRVSRQAEALIDPVEARTGVLETRAGQLETQAGQMDTRQRQLDDQQKQTEQQVGEVKTEVGEVKTQAGQANQGVENVNQRVTSLDNYQAKYSEVVYFSISSAKLTPENKQKLDNLVQEAKNEKGYAIAVSGYADKTGNASYNQQLSAQRANAVVEYLLQQGDVPVQRILTPAAMGTTHPASGDSTSAGRKLDRRVEVKVLLNQGIIAASNQTLATR